MDAALALFSSKGYESASVSEIVEEAKVGKPMVYYYFGSKEGLLKEIFRANYELFNIRLKEAAEYIPRPQKYWEDVRPLLARVANAYFEFAKSNPKFYALLLSVSFSPEMASARRASAPHSSMQHEILAEMFMKISESHGNLRGKEMKISRYFYALINSAIGSWMIGQGEIGKEEAEDLVNQFMHGIYS
ncbi:MAG: TetR/AcrR family transcriptional regulator; helix-turn-helix transcriptional regulator [Clostridiales bacterium]|nr:TetR/AcrR family transcriptional regulator; helix-turn-helix transcriptional regulator [Clostridiales bacterium]